MCLRVEACIYLVKEWGLTMPCTAAGLERCALHIDDRLISSEVTGDASCFREEDGGDKGLIGSRQERSKRPWDMSRDSHLRESPCQRSKEIRDPLESNTGVIKAQLIARAVGPSDDTSNWGRVQMILAGFCATTTVSLVSTRYEIHHRLRKV